MSGENIFAYSESSTPFITIVIKFYLYSYFSKQSFSFEISFHSWVIDEIIGIYKPSHAVLQPP